MKTTLVLNVGSSSVKFAVAHNGVIVLRGDLDHFGAHASVVIVHKNRTSTQTTQLRTLQDAMMMIRKTVVRFGYTPNVIVHRIVHGGQKFFRPERLTTVVVRYLQQLIPLAPLHQPSNLLGVHFAKNTWSHAVEWGVFDTAVYHTLPPRAREYALPRALAERLHIRKYGFHGISHAWAFRQAAQRCGKRPAVMSAVTLHLGSGASMTLWHNGKPIDTTMGFTPLEGLVMATRSGDLDPSIPLYLQQHLGWSANRVAHLLEEHAGMVGLSGMRDTRDILAATGHHVAGWKKKHWSVANRAKAALALEIFCYHVQRALAGYIGLLERVDAIIFTGPVAENTTMQKILLSNVPAARGIRHLTVHADEEQALVNAVS